MWAFLKQYFHLTPGSSIPQVSWFGIGEKNATRQKLIRGDLEQGLSSAERRAEGALPLFSADDLNSFFSEKI